MAIEIVDFPIKNCDFPLLCKRLPEGISQELVDRMQLARREQEVGMFFTNELKFSSKILRIQVEDVQECQGCTEKHQIPFGKRLRNYGKIHHVHPCSMDKSTINQHVQ